MSERVSPSDRVQALHDEIEMWERVSHLIDDIRQKERDARRALRDHPPKED
jgi:hypothetical protein